MAPLPLHLIPIFSMQLLNKSAYFNVVLLLYLIHKKLELNNALVFWQMHAAEFKERVYNADC